MTETQALLSFLVAAILVTMAPGLDTALILRTAISEGRAAGLRAVFGVATGCLIWGCLVSIGLGALIAASPIAFTMLKWAGAAYLLYVGVGLLLRPRRSFAVAETVDAAPARNRFWSGLMQNLLNPKACVFYLSFMPQFVPTGVRPTPFILLLTALAALLGVLWLGSLVLATERAAVLMRRPAVIRRLDRITGCVFVAFGLKLALSRR